MSVDTAMATTHETRSMSVRGTPRPGGSKRHVGKGRIVDDGGHKTAVWRTIVATEARRSFPGVPPMTGAIAVEVVFKMPRPQSHLGRAGNPLPSAPAFHTTRPDATKLWRSTEDALTGIMWSDDAQIVLQTIQKRYADTGEHPGVWINVMRAGRPPAFCAEIAELVRVTMSTWPDWRPIDSAPKDERVLVGWDALRMPPCIGWWDDDAYAVKPRPFWANDRLHMMGRRWTRDHPPTHWMPVPPGPEREK